MASCAAVGDGGVVVVTDEVYPACSAFVLVTPLEWQQSQSVFVPLSIDDASTIGGAALLVFALAWSFKLIGRFLQRSESSEGGE